MKGSQINLKAAFDLNFIESEKYWWNEEIRYAYEWERVFKDDVWGSSTVHVFSSN